ncbi:hypothetical protein PENTCL1PPCAC_1225, partial [Pristionchus entomophagus]
SLQCETRGLPLITCPLDVTKDESVAEARIFVDNNLKNGIQLWAVVANAGVFTCYGPDDWCTIDDYKFSVEINTFGVVRCVQRSTVIFRVSVPASGPYSVAKYGVEAYIDCIRFIWQMSPSGSRSVLSSLFGNHHWLQFTVSIPLVFGVIAAYYIARYVWEKNTVGNYQKKAVFISGCDSGFGRALAIKCAKAGLTVFAGCLTKGGEESLQSETRGLPLITCPLDVTKDESIADARKFVKENLKNGIKLWAVVANAGVFTVYGPDDWCTIDEYKFSVEVNTFGVVRCVQAFMDLIKESEGRIVAVSSVSGRVSVSATGPYSVAKYGVEAYIDCIRQETAAYGVKCSLLEPGAFKTALLDKEAMRKRADTKWNSLTPAKRESWGEEFKEWFIHNTNKTIDNFGSSNIDIVVNNYFHAITAKFPRCRYLCGLDAVLFWLPVSLLDARIQDRLLALLTTGGDVLSNDLKKKFAKK